MTNVHHRPPLSLHRLVLAMLALLTLFSGLNPAAAQVPPTDPTVTIDQIAVRQSLHIVTREGAPRLSQNQEPEPEPEIVPGQRALLRFTFRNNSNQPVRLTAINQLIWGDPHTPALAQVGEEPVERPAPWANFPLAPGATITFERPIDPQDTEPLSDELTLEPRDVDFVSRLTSPARSGRAALTPRQTRRSLRLMCCARRFAARIWAMRPIAPTILGCL
jgi:hypothetical protein